MQALRNYKHRVITQMGRYNFREYDFPREFTLAVMFSFNFH